MLSKLKTNYIYILNSYVLTLFDICYNNNTSYKFTTDVWVHNDFTHRNLFIVIADGRYIITTNRKNDLINRAYITLFSSSTKNYHYK